MPGGWIGRTPRSWWSLWARRAPVTPSARSPERTPRPWPAPSTRTRTAASVTSPEVTSAFWCGRACRLAR
eukprot:6833287-Lingulodinium_polyedra.AAC.1